MIQSHRLNGRELPVDRQRVTDDNALVEFSQPLAKHARLNHDALFRIGHQA